MSDDLTSGGTVLPITRWGEPVMHNRTRPVTDFDDDLHTLVRDMFATMEAAQGVGLAATQVGLDLAVFVFECPDADDVLHSGVVCNPVVTVPETRDRELESAEEGCLSFPGAYQVLARPNTAVCEGQDADGNPVRIEGTGLLARCLQHETDHLGGTVFGDRLSTRARRLLSRQQAELDHLYPDDWPVTPRRTSADEQPPRKENA
ncbi:peptide deformylase [Micropruina sonneratiae]|uniref:peptide deformylase n=1 Tax=Micropruina sonneratiae TaxID=2986940 RepID=UPI002227D625|nr:peptide deformylase [Micropruina sp. KQZ13P-5]MCW3157230.1 peptide deformylase [Micropruina sp. KQZ13P-5]